MLRWHDPYAVSGRWYRGNTHLHTFHGPAGAIRTDPEVIIDWYRAHGYHWLNLSDHCHVTRPATPAAGKRTDFVVLSGHESDCVVGIGVEGRADRADGTVDQRRERLAFWVDDIVSRGGVAQLAHPRATLGDWKKNLEWVIPLERLSLIELFNHRQGDYGGRIHWRRESKYAVDIWDELLRAGRTLWPVAVDDSHDYLQRPRIVDPDTGERAWEPIRDPGERFFESAGGWTWVRADGLTRHALLQGLRRGSVYASQGPSFRRLGLRDGLLAVRGAQCVEIHVIVDGEPAARASGTTLDWPMPDPVQGRYVRVELVDGSGRRAWSAPFRAREP